MYACTVSPSPVISLNELACASRENKGAPCLKGGHLLAEIVGIDSICGYMDFCYSVSFKKKERVFLEG